jgi:dethiobiotin synthetase
MTKFFITATDTDAGKTYVACALVRALVHTKETLGKIKSSNNKYKVAVYKPISAGCQVNKQGNLENEDALLLQAEANCQQKLLTINPITFAEPIAPHIAAMKTGQQISLAKIEQGLQDIEQFSPDFTIIEGAGGWRLPLGQGKFLSDFVKNTQLEVILVVNMKLGCLNQAVLTYEAIINDGLVCKAWVANSIESMPYLDENIAELTALLPVPLLARLGNNTDINLASTKFDLAILSN